MSKWEMVRLGDVCIIERGGSPRPIEKYITDDENGVNWIKIGDTSPNSMYITNTKEKIKPEGMKKSRQVHTGDFLLSNSMSFGRPYILKIDGCIHDGWLLIRDEYGIFDKRFLYYYLGSDKTYAEFKGLAVGGVVNNLNSTMVRNLKVLLPPLEVQRKIADVLDRASALLEKRKAQLDKLDLLVKSRFVEMFGDPVRNPMGWDTIALSKITSKIGSGATPKGGQESYVSEGISLVRSMNVHNGYFKYDDLVFITEEQAKQLDNVTLQENDVLLNITGASVARSCIVPFEVLPARVNQHVSILRCNPTHLNHSYANTMLISDSYQHYLLSIGESGGATRQAITKQQIEEFIIPLPPIKLQTRFADFVRATDKSKIAMQLSLAKLELNYKSLMQKCFNGEVF
ncbi:MAG: restriction endonuclease subunit S [Peptococcaceae bacterium]|nr:restriction endonuclease subunit S [Peptococcaceae bacterium]